MKSLLIFFRVIDEHDGKISLTNLAVIITLVKLSLAPATSIVDIGALCISLMNYAGKKLINQSATSKQEDPLSPKVNEIEQKLAEVQSQISALSIQSGMKRN